MIAVIFQECTLLLDQCSCALACPRAIFILLVIVNPVRLHKHLPASLQLCSFAVVRLHVYAAFGKQTEIRNLCAAQHPHALLSLSRYTRHYRVRWQGTAIAITHLNDPFVADVFKQHEIVAFPPSVDFVIKLSKVRRVLHSTRSCIA